MTKIAWFADPQCWQWHLGAQTELPGHVREVSWGDQELFQRKTQGWANSSVDKELGLLA